MTDARVFSIPPGVPFLTTLADALADGSLVPGLSAGDPAALADAVIYLPTRRAARALASLMAERTGARAALLPRIIPLGEAEEAEFALAADHPGLESAAALQPPIAPLERRLVLTRLIQAWSRAVDRDLLRLRPDIPFLVPSSPADAVGLAGDLEGLMDAFTTENVDWERLADAVEADYSEYFRITREFVAIAARSWPDILAERGASDPARRQRLLLLAEAERLAASPPPHAVIAAGSTGSVPATAALLAAIARLPRGAVVLPGLDGDLDGPSWSALGGGAEADEPVHGHPQAMMRRLLDEHLKIPREAVLPLGSPAPQARARAMLLSEALRPAETTDRWAAMPADVRARLAREGCAGLTLVEAPDEREEALAIAVALRETLAEAGRTAALVTPDRNLALRVCAELDRWGVTADDSAGVPLADTEAGRLARLAAEAAAEDFEPLRLLALLAHPAVRLGLKRVEVERAARVLEIGVLRGPEPAPHLDGLGRALALRRAETERLPRPRRRLAAADWDLAAELLQRLAIAFGSFTSPTQGGNALDLVALAEDHRRTVEALVDAGPDSDEAAMDDGSAEAVSALFDDLGLAGPGVTGRFVDYPAFFAEVARTRAVNPPAPAAHRRVRILGLLEARLLSADRVVLGGLDEGVWPPRVQTDAFLNRPMRGAVGLDPPERRIGQTAHDFVQALGVHDVVITRAAKRDGAPMVPSRFLQRLKAFVGEETWTGLTGAGTRYLDLARALDEPRPVPPLARPAPRPDPALIPRALSVTEIETLVRDPYAIFARKILKLDALDRLAAPPDASDRGTIIHDIFADFAREHPDRVPDNAVEILLQKGEDAFLPIAEAYPDLYAEWWPRFQRLAAAFAVWEDLRRGHTRRIAVEHAGALKLAIAGETFTLRARADRLEERVDGRGVVIDFKTGQPPSDKEVFAGFAPQLTLEAAMLMRGAFEGFPPTPETPDLLYVRASGGREPLVPREVKPPKGSDRTVAGTVDEHLRKLEGLITRYLAGEAGFTSRPFPKYAQRYSDYDHLARVKEWSALSAGGEEGGA